MRSRISVLVAAFLITRGAAVHAQTQPTPQERDPALAGVLSFLIPGLGSLYADNKPHAWLHFGAYVAGVAVIASSDVVDSCSTADSCQTTGQSQVYAGLGIILVNSVWSIFTAVHDAHAFNDAHAAPGHVVGNLYLRPDVHVTRTLAPSGRAPGRMGLQLFTLEF